MPRLAIISALLFVGLVLILWFVQAGSLWLAVLLGGIVPLAISLISLQIFTLQVERQQQQFNPREFMLINFFSKVLLIGMMLAAVLLGTDLPRIPFVFSLVGTFLGWHILEAMHYQKRLNKLAAENSRSEDLRNSD